MINEYVLETLIAFLTFASVRYSLPNFILNKEISLWSGFVLSFCYALCAFIRKYARLYF